MRYTITIICFILLAIPAFAKKGVLHLVEAENFNNKGGWVVDQQFMDQMGSPFLLAHGMGKPVENASTEINNLSKGKWHVFARTWNWCSPWKIKESPGLFKLSFNGTFLENELGKGEQWGWEYAGTVEATSSTNKLSLVDLTGFEGRCDAIIFSKESNIYLPNVGAELYQFRKRLLNLPKEPKKAGKFDLVVVGAGTAGMSTAIEAARQGLSVALINNRPVLGGNSSPEVKVVISGELMRSPYPKLGSVTKEIKTRFQKQDETTELIVSEKNISYFPNMHVFAAETKQATIKSVTAKHIETSEELLFEAPLFADCTGDGSVGYLAGALYRVGREMRSDSRETLAPDRPDNIVLGATISWNSKMQQQEVDFPICNWAIQFTDESCEKVINGSNWWETGFRYDQVNEAEYIRDYLFRAIYGNWSFLKNKSKFKNEYSKRELNWMTYISGKRESRRLIGDVILMQQDIEGAYTRYDDAIVWATYSIDQHFPTPKNTFFFPGEEFISTMRHNFNDLGVSRRYLRDDQVNPPYQIPYRCLYSQNINNLFMAGRNISVSHISLSSTRVQGTTGMMGELVAAAAMLCKRHNCSPREIYKNHLEELKQLFK